MKSYADLIQSGLLALLGGDDENATFEELPPKTPQGWQKETATRWK